MNILVATHIPPTTLSGHVRAVLERFHHGTSHLGSPRELAVIIESNQSLNVAL
jgi:hypothetical protein